MLHSINTDDVQRGEEMTRAIQTCVHCGFCLPTCPTYDVMGQEMDSPRGRIFLMKEVLEGKLDVEAASPHLDTCLGCLACESNCPSGVQYGELISPFRATQQSKNQPLTVRLKRWLAATTLPYPGRFRAAIRFGAIGKVLRPIVPSALKPMVDMLPDKLPPAEHLPERTDAKGEVKATVALLAGCAQQVLQPDINQATIRVLSENGIQTVVPKAQGCCGALAWHTGDEQRAVRFASNNLNAFPDDVEAIITNAAGCGSGLHDYPMIMHGTSLQPAAESFAEKCIDISKYLAQIEITPPPALSRPLRIAYHDACHLCHAQRVRSQPRKLLESIPGVSLIPLEDSEFCCGSAGTYNIDQPEIAEQLGKRKAEKIQQTGCDIVALGNIGCMVQIQKHLEKLGTQLPVLHTVQILDRAYRQVL